MAQIKTSIFKLSIPTKAQVIASVERVVAVFLVAAFSVWQVSNYQFSKAAGIAAITAGIAAVYQALRSVLTSL